MKKLKVVIRLSLILGLVYFVAATIVAFDVIGDIEKSYVSKNLEEGDSLSFGQEYINESNISGSTRSHGYDGKRYNIDHENGVFVISKLHQSNIQSQNQVAASYVKGVMRYENDTLVIQLKSQFKYLYVSTLDSMKPLDVYQGECTIKAVSKDLSGEFGSVYLSGMDMYEWGWSIYSLPIKVKKDELFKAEHPINTIAKFDLFQIENKGVTTTYNRTDLLLIGADELTMKIQE
ncbi:MAG: hypothetical protein ACI9JN_000495 [Bacteroidia bacterium]|jgi:hypothetical protein